MSFGGNPFGAESDTSNPFGAAVSTDIFGKRENDENTEHPDFHAKKPKSQLNPNAPAFAPSWAKPSGPPPGPREFKYFW